MAYVKDTGTPGTNNAELPLGAVLDTGAKTLSLVADTELQSAVVLEEKEWLVLETRNVNDTINLIGECIYSEDAGDLGDIPTFANDVRTRMIALHTTFELTVTHYKTSGVVDVYRGDETTVTSLAVDDTGLVFSHPAVWTIDDVEVFAPTTPSASTNIVQDPTCDNAGDWSGLSAYVGITGSKLEINNTSGSGQRAYFNLSESLEVGITYILGCDVEVNTGSVGFRFYLGNDDVGFKYGTGTKTQTIEYTGGNDTASIQFLDGFVGTCDNFTCTRV